MTPRLFSILAFSLLFLSTTICHAGGRTAQQIFQEGVSLFKVERYAEAKARFERVLRAQPNYAPARSFLARANLAISKGGPKLPGLDKKLNGLILPQLNFDRAPVGDVLDFLSKRVLEVSDGKIGANVIFKGTEEERERPITLQLRNVPVTDAFRYVTEVSRLRLRYEPHAVVVSSLAPIEAPAAAAAPGVRTSPNLSPAASRVFGQ